MNYLGGYGGNEIGKKECLQGQWGYGDGPKNVDSQLAASLSYLFVRKYAEDNLERTTPLLSLWPYTPVWNL